jgi:hypothetical protein
MTGAEESAGLFLLRRLADCLRRGGIDAQSVRWEPLKASTCSNVHSLM